MDKRIWQRKDSCQYDFEDEESGLRGLNKLVIHEDLNNIKNVLSRKKQKVSKRSWER